MRARDSFLAIAAHELRNPMYALGLHLGLAVKAAERSGDDTLIEYLRGAKIALDRYVERATTLLDVSRLNAGHSQVRVEDVDFAAVVRQVVAGFEAEAAFTGAGLSARIPRRLAGRCDRMALEQIVGNLVSNGIRYGAGHPVRVILARDGADAVIAVRDQGPGIPPDEQERIFGRFEQVVDMDMRAGFGIGLWLARSLAQALGGTITLASAPGAGSTFTVRLPLDGPAGT